MAKFFARPAQFRSWLERHAALESELIVGFHKRHTEKPSMTWPEAVDEVLCFGWIDGVRKRIGERSYQIRFTPRRASGTWSAVNIVRASILASQGRMAPAGLDAFARRTEAKSRTYAYEQRAGVELHPAAQARFRKSKAAWAFFLKQPPSYRQKAIWWVVSAKQEATREKRLAQLVESSQNAKRL